jgi:capsid protein
MDAAVVSRALILPGYETDPWPYLQAIWTPPPWPWVDPESDVNSAIKEVRAGFTTRDDVCAGKGTDRATVDRKQKQDAESEDEAGMKYDSDSRNAASGAAAPVPSKAQAQEQGAQQPAEQGANQ